MFMGEAGREMVGKYAQDVTDYYCMASELDNHCVRESACHSIAEMAEKVQVVSEPCSTSPMALTALFSVLTGNIHQELLWSCYGKFWKRVLAFVLVWTSAV